MRAIGRTILIVLLGGLLMFVGHFGAFLAYATNLRHAPYWWSYLLLYPLAAVLIVRRGWLGPLTAALAICALPALYFLALGVLESNWTASDSAIIGVGAAFVLALAAGSWARPSRQQAQPAA